SLHDALPISCPCDRDACQRRSGAIFADDPDPRDILTACDKDIACDRGGEVIAADHRDTLGPTRVPRTYYRDVAVDLERHTPTAADIRVYAHGVCSLDRDVVDGDREVIGAIDSNTSSDGVGGGDDDRAFDAHRGIR